MNIMHVPVATAMLVNICNNTWQRKVYGSYKAHVVLVIPVAMFLILEAIYLVM